MRREFPRQMLRWEAGRYLYLVNTLLLEREIEDLKLPRLSMTTIVEEEEV